MARTSIEIADAPEAVWSVLTDADASGISVVDSTVVVEYLAAAADVDVEGSPVVEIGGAEEMTYQPLLEEYARPAGARPATVLIPVPASPLRSRTGRRGPSPSSVQANVQETLRLLGSLGTRPSSATAPPKSSLSGR